jgi:hypothetical protein
MKITRPETITFTREKEIGIECDMCHKHTTIRDNYPSVTDNWATEKGKYNHGCVVSTYHGYFMDMIGPTIRESELCTDCATKVLDWIESQGGTTTTTHR